MKNLLLSVILLGTVVNTAYAGRETGTDFAPGVTNTTPDPSAYAQVTADKKLFLEAGERNPSSATTSYVAVRNEANLAIISKTAAVTIGGGVAGDTHLLKIEFQTALAGTCVITGFADSDGAAQSITLAIGTVGPKDFLGAINSAGALTITCSDAGDDNKPWVFWRPR